MTIQSINLWHFQAAVKGGAIRDHIPGAHARVFNLPVAWQGNIALIPYWGFGPDAMVVCLFMPGQLGRGDRNANSVDLSKEWCFRYIFGAKSNNMDATFLIY